MPTFDDFLLLTEDVPFPLVDAYQNHRGRFAVGLIALVLLSLVIALPRMSGKLSLADEQFVTHITAQTSASPMRTIITIENHLAGDHLGFQLTGATLHSANVVLLWLILRRLRVPGAWLAAAVFAVHPIELQAVAWVGQQNRLWAALCFLGSTLVYFRIAGVPPLVPDDVAYAGADLDQSSDNDPELAPSLTRRVFANAAALALFAAGVLFQPIGVVVILPIVLLIAWSRGLRRSDWSTFAPLAVVAVAILVTIAIHRDIAGFSAAADRGPALPERGRAVLVHAGLAVTRIIWPFPVIVDIDDGPKTFSSSLGYISIAATLSALAASWLLRRRVGLGPAAALACFICLIPTFADLGLAAQFSHLVPGRDAYGYLASTPLIALFVAALVTGIAAVTRSSSHVVVAIARTLLAMAVIAPIALITWNAAWAYTSTETIWSAVARHDPSALRPRVRLAESYLMQRNVDAAEAQLAAVDPNQCEDGDALITRAMIFETRRDLDSAIRCYVRAESLDSHDPRIKSHLADAYAAGGDAAAAIAFFETSLKQGRDANLLNDYGLFLARHGEMSAADDKFRAAIDSDDRFAPARINLASSLFARGELAAAAEQLQAAVKADPKNFDAFHNAGVMLCQLKDFEKAEKMLRVAVRLKPDSPEARNDLGVCLVALGKLNAAIFEFQQAVTLRPSYDSAQNNLKIARARMTSQTRPTR